MRRSVISKKGERQWQGIPTIERAEGGRLWSAFFTGGPREPHPDNHIVITTSSDDGREWSEPEPVVDPPGRTRAYDPCLWHDPEGTLWLFYNLANRESGDYSVWAMRACNSDSDELRWSEAQKIELGVPFAFRLNKPTVLDGGDWLLPVTWARSVPEGWFARGEQLQGAALSSDSGESWTLHGAVEAPSWTLENMIVERLDQRLWMLIRTGDGVLWQSFSEDQGRTWTEGSPTDIVNPGARFCIRRLESGRLLLINTPNPEQRKTLYAYLSCPDDDETFSERLLLDDRDGVSYPDAVQAPDGRIFAVNDHDRGGLGEIVLSIFTEEF